MTQDQDIQALQSTANAIKLGEYAILGSALASVGIAFGVHWMHYKGASLIKTLALGVLSEGIQVGGILLVMGWAGNKDDNFTVSGMLDAANPKVTPYFPYVLEKHAHKIDVSKLTMSAEQMRVWSDRGDRLIAGTKKISDFLEYVDVWILAIPLVPLVSAGLGRLLQGGRPWQSVATCGVVSTGSLLWAGIMAGGYGNKVGLRWAEYKKLAEAKERAKADQ